MLHSTLLCHGSIYILHSTVLYITLPGLCLTRLYSQWLYFTPLDSTVFYTIALLHSTWPLFLYQLAQAHPHNILHFLVVNYPTIALLYSTLLCISLPWLYSTLLDSTLHYHDSTWLYITLQQLYFTPLPSTIHLLQSTRLYTTLPWLYFTLHYSTKVLLRATLY